MTTRKSKTREELDRISEDSEYWEQFEPILGLRLGSFTEKSYALFFGDPRGSLALPGHTAQNILDFVNRTLTRTKP